MSEALKKLRGGRREGSGRKKRNTKTVTLRLSPEVIAVVHLIAKRDGTSLSGLIESRLRESLLKP